MRLIITSTFKFSTTKAAGGGSEHGNPLQKLREKTEKEAVRFLWRAKLLEFLIRADGSRDHPGGGPSAPACDRKQRVYG